MIHVRFSILLAACAISGCASTPPLGGAGTTVVSSTQLPAPGRADLLSNTKAYMIGPFDKLRIDVFGVTELSNREVQVDAGGNMSFPLIGTLMAGGRTPAELAADIASKLTGRFIRNPQVTVNVAEIVSQQVTVDGEVLKPGLYPIVGKMTLARAVAYAGGVSEYAKLEEVVILRSVNGQRYAALYDLKAIRRGVYDDPEIYANDLVVVGNSPSRRLFRDLLQASPLLTTPLVLLLKK